MRAENSMQPATQSGKADPTMVTSANGDGFRVSWRIGTRAATAAVPAGRFPRGATEVLLAVDLLPEGGRLPSDTAAVRVSLETVGGDVIADLTELLPGSHALAAIGVDEASGTINIDAPSVCRVTLDTSGDMRRGMSGNGSGLRILFAQTPLMHTLGLHGGRYEPHAAEVRGETARDALAGSSASDAAGTDADLEHESLMGDERRRIGGFDRSGDRSGDRGTGERAAGRGMRGVTPSQARTGRLRARSG
ncbi:MAG: hypothetical protein AAF235_00460 [Planctomycetota bacterium]